MPQLQNIPTFIFQQDGSPAHFHCEVRQYLNTLLPGRWIGRASGNDQSLLLWSPRSPDITPCDFFLLGGGGICQRPSIRPTIATWPRWPKGRARSEPDGTRWRTGGEVKGKLANGVGSQYSHATTEHGVSSITKADVHTSAASSRLNWRPHRFKWPRPFRRKTKCGFCACVITFRTSYTDHCNSEEYRCTHVNACVARTWIPYRCVPCYPWCKHRTSLVVKKGFSVFLWLWTIPLR